MSTIKATNLQGPSAATPAIVLAADGTATAQVSSLNGGQLAGLRNRIINGNMLWTQRYGLTSPTFGVGAAYVIDRWLGNATIASNMRVGRSSDAPVGFTTSQKADAVTGATIAAGTSFTIGQRIEGLNVSDLGFGTANASTVTVSFWVKSSITGTHSGSLRNNDVTRSYIFSYAIAAANTWEKKSITIPGDVTGTWNTELFTGIDLIFDLGNGSTYRNTTGSWRAGNFVGATGAVSVMATAGASWFITGVQLEAGSVATPFERLDLGTQLNLVLRYYATLSNADTLPVTAFTDQARGYFKLPASMRTTPTCTFTYDIGGGATWAIGFNGGYQASANSNVSGFALSANAEL